MDAEPPTARFQMDERLRRPGHRNHYLEHELHRIRGMLVPHLLVDLIATGAWARVADATMHSAIPDLPRFVNLELISSMETLTRVGENIRYNAEHFGTLGMIDGSKAETSVDLPLLDLQRCFFIGFGQRDGDDTWLALYYAESPDANPSVVTNKFGSHINTAGSHCDWYTVTNTFTEFATRLGVDGQDAR